MIKKGLDYSQRVISDHRDTFCGIGIGNTIGTLFALVICTALVL